MDPEDFRFDRHAAEAIAPGWERRGAFVEEMAAPVREWMVRELAPRRGDTLLELAAGAGETGFDAVATVGEGGRLISTDVSPAMVEIARRRGSELGVGSVDYRVMDAERIELGADSVDGVLCRFGYMLATDPATALSETRRVLRPGGRLAMAVWGAPERNPFFAIVAVTLIERGHLPRPDPGGPSPFRLANEKRTKALLESAGFTSVRTANVPVRYPFADIEEYMTITTDIAGPIALVLRALPERERQSVKAQLAKAFTRFASDGGYELPGLALCAVAS